MIEWEDYIESLLNQKSPLDNINIHLPGETMATRVPPIVKASILMLERMIDKQGKYNIFVFPEKTQTSFIFMLLKTIYNIAIGKIDKAYDPHTFVKGQKLRLGKWVVEFDGIEFLDGSEMMFVKFSDPGRYAVPIEKVPYMQLAETKRLSTYATFVKEFNYGESITNIKESDFDIVRDLKNHKTHMDNSVFYVGPITITKELCFATRLNDLKLEDVLLLGRTNINGEINNLTAGQLSGHRSIILSSDLYPVSAAIKKGIAIQSLIIDVSNPNIITSQLEIFDEFMKIEFPILCLTDTLNSFDLQPLLDRGYNLWRWDQTYITDSLFGVAPISSDRKIKNCAERNVEYINIEGDEICIPIKKLYFYKNHVKEQSGCMYEVFDRLFKLSCKALRTIIPITGQERDVIQDQLLNCEHKLSLEKRFISEESFNDYQEVISTLRRIFASSYLFPKIKAIQEHLLLSNSSNVCIVIPEREDKMICQYYWDNWILTQGIDINVTVMTPSDYYVATTEISFSETIVVGWFSKNMMKTILYGFNTSQYLVLLYACELKWKDSHTAAWFSILSNKNNYNIIKTSFQSQSYEIGLSEPTDERECLKKGNIDPFELEEIECLLDENRFGRYVAGRERSDLQNTVEAIPVGFAGGFISFYKATHQIIKATGIIVNDDEEIEMIMPGSLHVGDFIVMRKTDHNLIKEIADIVLANNGKSYLRELSSKWKNPLETESISSTNEEIYEKLCAAGCTRNYQTIRVWITEKNIIAPQSKQDLVCIAKAMQDSVLMEMIDAVWDAAVAVRSVHITAGKYLSTLLKNNIVSALHDHSSINPCDIWSPIEMSLEGIGKVLILKVINVGKKVSVDDINTNCLIEEK